MKTDNRTNWTDVDWAKHLSCPVNQVAQYRDWVNKNYIAYVACDSETKKYFVCVDRYDLSPSGTQRLLSLITSETQFKSETLAMQYAVDKFIPSLQLSEFNAKMNSVPAMAIQMLTIKQK